MVTVAANDDEELVHPRMPAILEPEEYAAWLAPDTPERELKALLWPYQAGGLVPVAVGPRVSKVQYDDPACLTPAA